MVISSAQRQLTFILESELGFTLRKCVTGPHFRGVNVVGREVLGIVTLLVLQNITINQWSLFLVKFVISR